MMTTIQFEYAEPASQIKVEQATMFDFQTAVDAFKKANPSTTLTDEKVLYSFAPMGLLSLEVI